MEATKVMTNHTPRSARSFSAAATAPARKSSYRPLLQQPLNSSPMARCATAARDAIPRGSRRETSTEETGARASRAM